MLPKKLYIVFLLIIQVLFSQVPDIDLSFRQEESRQKARQYQLYKQALQQRSTNQKKYDIKYYGLNLSIDISDKRIAGYVQIDGEIISDSLSKIDLNFWQGMSVTDIYQTKSFQTNLEYTHSNDILSVKLASTKEDGDNFSFYIKYQGKPSDNPYRDFTFDKYNDKSMVWTLNEPFGARAWIPCKDVPSDKADSMDIRVTVPEGLDVVSNGLLKNKIEKADSTTFWWHEKYPIATYLISLAIHPYHKFSDWYIYDNDSMEVQYYVFQDNYPGREEDYKKTVDMINFFSSKFGLYPFLDEKYGHAEITWAGGMEHQTISSMGGASEMLISHELAHQWWGDAVTCHSFHDLWLNEGFASYSEALWFEFAYQNFTASDYQKYSEYFGPGTIYIEKLEEEDLFDYNLRYNKASWVLHMLRHVVGDSVFFEILNKYYTSNKFQYKSATTEDFIELCNQVSDLNLNKFFQQWLYGQYYPKYSYSWNSTKVKNGYKINLHIQQVQNKTGPFWMPIDIRVLTNNKNYNFTVMDSTRSQKFDLIVQENPRDILLDPDNWILNKIKRPDFFVSKNYQKKYQLSKNYPNPFNSSTNIPFNVPHYSHVNLIIYNNLGQKIIELVNRKLRPGKYEINFNQDNIPSGTYYYQLIADNFTKAKKMVLLK